MRTIDEQDGQATRSGRWGRRFKSCHSDQQAPRYAHRYVPADALEGSSVSGRGLRVEKAFGVSMDTLMRMQSSYNIAQARKRKGKIKVAPYRPVANIPNPKQPTLI